MGQTTALWTGPRKSKDRARIAFRFVLTPDSYCRKSRLRTIFARPFYKLRAFGKRASYIKKAQPSALLMGLVVAAMVPIDLGRTPNAWPVIQRGLVMRR